MWQYTELTKFFSLSLFLLVEIKCFIFNFLTAKDLYDRIYRKLLISFKGEWQEIESKNKQGK